MAFTPIAYIAPNYRDFKNEWLKAYEPGTTTPKIMATDSSGSPTVAKLQLNADGFLVSAGAALVIPYIEDAYDLWLFPTEAEADANDTSNAERLADDLTGGLNQAGLDEALINDLSQAYESDNIAALTVDTTILPAGKLVSVGGYYAGWGATLDGGGSSCTFTVKTSAQAASDGDDVDELINHTLADGKVAIFIRVGAIHVKQAGAKPDGAFDSYLSISAAANRKGIVDFSSGSTSANDVYITSRAIQVGSNTSIKSDLKAILKRTDTTSEVINTRTMTCVMVLIGETIKVDGLKVFGVFRGTDIDGIILDKVNNSSLVDVEVNSCNKGLSSTAANFMMRFDRVKASGCQTRAFDFSNPSFKTTLTFSDCWAVNCGHTWFFDSTTYSTMTDCGADWSGWAADNSQYGVNTIIGDPATSLGIYHFVASNFTLNSVATENCFGNGYINVNGGNSTLTVNTPVCENGLSSFNPDYGAKPNFVTGAIQVGESGANVHVTCARPLDFENTFTTAQGKVQAEVLAYNYTGAIDNLACLVSVTSATGIIIAGQDSANVVNNTLVLSEQKRNARFTESVRVGDTFTRTAKPVGTGTIITIPFISQATNRRAHQLRCMILDGDTTGITVPNSATVDFGLMSLTSLSGLQIGLNSAVVGISRTGLDLFITLNVAVTDPFIRMDILSQNIGLIDFDNISIA